jgi:DNA-binding CsgD family transcriptional regulator
MVGMADDAAATADLLAARAASACHDWQQARAGFLALRSCGPLAASDMEALAEAAWWEGAIDESLSAYEEAYRLYLHGDVPERRPAAMLAMDIGFSWLLRGEEAMGSGWLSRANRLLDGLPECAEHGYLRSFELEAAAAEGDFDTAIAVARSLAAFAERFGDETLCAYALVSEGIARIKQGDVSHGLVVLDEAMLPVVAGRVRPAFVGNIYCQLMAVCHELADVRRAQQWTDATARWCAGFSNAVMFLGICRVHRAQLLQVRGQWAQAETEIALVCSELVEMNIVAVGLAFYELGEIRRLRGDLDGAEQAYADAHQRGRDPHPGLALARSARGRHREALDALLGAEEATAQRLAKTPLWQAIVDVAVETGDLPTARRACDELQAAAEVYGSSGLLAAAALAQGQVCVAEGKLEEALQSLVSARHRWQQLGAPVRVAEVRRQLSKAHLALGNERAAALEAAAADRELTNLGTVARPSAAAAPSSGLTRREAEVLELVARGLSNRAVAEQLVLSEKTVARHLANVYLKLGVNSRTAAAAYAHAHGLVRPSA